MIPNKIIFFDGVCNLCNRLVIFIIKRDRSRIFKFASLQSAKAEEMGIIQKDKTLNTIIFFSENKLYQKSSAVLHICKLLPFPWPLLFGFIIVPRFIRDSVYNFVADNRYKWFGKKDQCMVPSENIEDRFLK
ncbi:MAG: thiol-disulfide oxidoreductase DCC family protein [Ginsengibacter sp.]